MTDATILVVEDDENLRLALQDNLVDEGYRVYTAADGAQADAMLEKEPDVIVLDIMLPDTDGYSLCERWRARGCKVMIIMLTARSLEDDIVKGFQAGADDYVLKPYRLQEFLLRVKALLKRSGRVQPAPMCLPGFTIDYQARRVINGYGEEIPFTRKEYDLLVYLVENSHRALTRDEILNAVWGRDVIVDERTVDNFVSNLKKKLAWNEKSRFRIATIRGVGYRMELEDNG